MNRQEFKIRFKDASDNVDRNRLKMLIKRNIESQDDKNNLLIIVMEEFAELTQQISKVLRNRKDRQCLIEEIADTTLMLEVLKKICEIKGWEVNKAINVKMDRLEFILNEIGKYE